nr:hypothetical protein CFP56_04465 [Quercus suber]
MPGVDAYVPTSATAAGCEVEPLRSIYLAEPSRRPNHASDQILITRWFAGRSMGPSSTCVQLFWLARVSYRAAEPDLRGLTWRMGHRVAEERLPSSHAPSIPHNARVVVLRYRRTGSPGAQSHPIHIAARSNPQASACPFSRLSVIHRSPSLQANHTTTSNMFHATLLAAFAGLVSVQAQQVSNYSLTGNISVVPSSVPLNQRQDWCTAQMHSCPQICGGEGAYPNNCDANTLDYQCVCTSGISPNISDYDQTIPSFVCMQWIADCTLANVGNQNGQAGCQSLVCGQLNASSGEPKLGATGNPQPASTVVQTTAAPSSTGSADSTMTTTTSTTSGSASAVTNSASATPSSGATVVYVAKQYGTGILATGLLALFGLAL